MKKLETVMKVITIVLICVLCVLVNRIETNKTCCHCVKKNTISLEHYPMKMFNPISGIENLTTNCWCNDNCPNIHKTTK